MKRIILISMFVSLVLSLTGCTVVKEHYVRRGPSPHASLSHRRYSRPVLPPRRYPAHPGRPSYRSRHRRSHYVH
ncbi:MAG: hypothetical protein ACYS32_17720 [Planctomycetota bacterium]